MSDDDLDIYADDDKAPVGIDRKVLLLILAGMAGLAVTLSILRVRMKPTAPTTLGSLPEGLSWEASLQHVCDTFDLRLAGIDQRLNALANEKVVQAATYSAPPTTLVNSAGGTQDVERIPPTVAVGPESAPPQTAAVSMPPSE